MSLQSLKEVNLVLLCLPSWYFDYTVASPGVEFILAVLSLCPSSWLSLCHQDLGGYAVCHSACETHTKSFSCDLFELMVQNIVKHPAHPKAISKVQWADTNGLWYTSMVKTHMPDPHIFTSACTCTDIYIYKPYLRPQGPKSRSLLPEALAVCVIGKVW